MRRTGSNILAPGLRPEGLSDSSFSRLHRCSEHGQFVRQADIMPAFLLQRSWNSAGRTDYKSVFHSQTIGLWEIVSSYSSATAPASHRISRADPLFQTRKELKRAIAACASPFKIYLVRRVFR